MLGSPSTSSSSILCGRAYPGWLGASRGAGRSPAGPRGMIAGVPGRRRTPWWGLLSATAAPVLLIGGWTLAASRQQGGFDPVRRTISALAARDADDRWVMTTALVGLGLCHVTTALAVRRAANPGPGDAGRRRRGHRARRGVPATRGGPFLGGAHRGGGHRVRGVGRVAAAGPANRLGPVLSAPVSVAAGVVLLALVGWFFAELVADSGRVGLSERVAAGAQALWPAVVAWGTAGVTSRRSGR